MAGEISEVARHHCCHRAKSLHFRSNRADIVAIGEIIQRNVITAARKPESNGPAYAAPRPGDECRTHAFPQTLPPETIPLPLQ